MTSIVFGASGNVGRFIVTQLAERGERVIAISRKQRTAAPGIEWQIGDITKPAEIRLADADTLYCTLLITELASALPQLHAPTLRRLIAFSSSSVLTKADSAVASERDLIARMIEAEVAIAEWCKSHGIAWTILRPTLIYLEGHDANITRLARIIKRFGIMPVVGRADGRRQPVHAVDLATGAISAGSSPRAENKYYVLAGGETISYREMMGRIFDGVGRRRWIVGLPSWLWRNAFALAGRFLPGFNAEMGTRMLKDMTFDDHDARADFGWSPRDFRPRFQL